MSGDGGAARGKDALRRQDWRSAAQLLSAIPPGEASVENYLDLALAYRMQSNMSAAVAALDAALVLEPRNFLALLSKGAVLERLNRAKEAAGVYKNAVAVAPPPDILPASLTAPLARARAVARGHAEALAAHLRAGVAPLREQFAGQDLDRFDESVAIYAGLARPYTQEPLLLHYPRLPAIPFYNRELFPWLADLEAATPVLQAELAGAMAAGAGDFAPYIAFPPGVPVNQWAALNHSRAWSSFFLWRDGVRQESACALCPRTTALLASLPMSDQPGFAPTAMFSILDAKTAIPPHTGSANTRLIVHLPLVLPGPARFRVGAVTRPWAMGEAWVFDDTIEHEAWNDSDQPRTILIFDIWNPLLSAAERALISAMMTAKNAFQAVG